jgi:DNA-binding NtrC family response regulator
MKSFRVLIVEDDDSFRDMLSLRLARMGHAVSAVALGQEALDHLARHPTDAVLLDIGLPDADGLEILKRIRDHERPAEVIVMTAQASLDAVVKATRSEALDFLPKPFQLWELEAALRRASRKLAARRHHDALRHYLSHPFFPRLIAESATMREAVELTRKSAASDIPVLLLGETGTGKDLLARTLHLESPRREEPFLAINCASIREGLLESELFGHEKGAFTGASALKQGCFEAADGGTLFLDEVGELPPEAQAALLRVLEGGEIRRVGGTVPLTVDVRLITASNREPAVEVEAGRFRKDLFFRLNALTIRIPSLRDRREDIAPLAAHFLERLSGRVPKHLSSQALSLLQGYPWPGNVRELRNILERLVLLVPEGRIEVEDLPDEIRKPKAPRQEGAGDLTLRGAERRHIQWVLERSGGNKTQAAKALEISKATLYKKLREPGPSPFPA